MAYLVHWVNVGRWFLKPFSVLWLDRRQRPTRVWLLVLRFSRLELSAMGAKPKEVPVAQRGDEGQSLEEAIHQGSFDD